MSRVDEKTIFSFKNNKNNFLANSFTLNCVDSQSDCFIFEENFRSNRIPC